MRTYGLLAVAAIVGLAGCQPAETPQQMQARMDKETAAFKQYSTALEKRWEAWEANDQPDSIASIFTEDGRDMRPNAPAAVGRKAIRDADAQELGMGKFTLRITQESATANGPLAVDAGTYSFTFVPNKGMENMGVPPADTGKYLAHWQNVNGTWQVAALAYSSNRPLPMPTKAPAAKTRTRRK
jgi:ketosteroid isomerase-like protein